MAFELIETTLHTETYICQVFLTCIHVPVSSVSLQHYNLFKSSVLYSSVSSNNGPWMMFLQYMQSMCRWSVSSAFTAVQ